MVLFLSHNIIRGDVGETIKRERLPSLFPLTVWERKHHRHTSILCSRLQPFNNNAQYILWVYGSRVRVFSNAFSPFSLALSSTTYDDPRLNRNMRNKLRRHFFCHPTSLSLSLSLSSTCSCVWACMYVCMYVYNVYMRWCVFFRERARAPFSVRSSRVFSMEISFSVFSSSFRRFKKFRENQVHRNRHARPISPRDHHPRRGNHLVIPPRRA